MKWYDIFGVLVGARVSIRRVIDTPGAVGLGAALVATAAFAREYDSVSLLHHPIDLLAPFAASLALSALLFACVRFAALTAGRYILRTPWEDYRVFLSGYWMTAPLAWLYAIPIESLTDELTAIRFNLTALSVVSIWRVLAFARFVSVAYRIPAITALSWILVPCMAVALVALFQSMMSMVTIMGGLHLTATQKVLLDFQGAVLTLCFWGFVPTLMVALWLTLHQRRSSLTAPIRSRRARSLSATVWVVPALAAVVLSVGLSVFQPLQIRAAEIGSLIEQGQYQTAIAQMERLGRESFPAVWDPPPQFSRRRPSEIPIGPLIDALASDPPEPWVTKSLLVQADEILLQQAGWSQGTGNENYLRSMLFTIGEPTLLELKPSLQQLATLTVEPSEHDRLQRLVDIVDESIDHARKNLTAEAQGP